MENLKGEIRIEGDDGVVVTIPFGEGKATPLPVVLEDGSKDIHIQKFDDAVAIVRRTYGAALYREAKAR